MFWTDKSEIIVAIYSVHPKSIEVSNILERGG